MNKEGWRSYLKKSIIKERKIRDKIKEEQMKWISLGSLRFLIW